MWALDFEVTWQQLMVNFTVAQLTQWACSRFIKLPYDFRSALISSLSLCLLLRTNSIMWCAVAAVITIASKFLIRYGNKHIFNPTNFGIALITFITDQAWISPGQWGTGTVAAFLVMCIGITVVVGAYRADVTFAFLGFYTGLLAPF